MKKLFLSPEGIKVLLTLFSLVLDIIILNNTGAGMSGKGKYRKSI